MNFMKAYLVKALGKKLEDIVINSMIHPTALTKNNEYIKKCFGDRLMIPFLGYKKTKKAITLIHLMDFYLSTIFNNRNVFPMKYEYG